MSRNPVDVLKAIAARLPQVEKGVACEGTSLEATTFKANKKAFLFLGKGHARFKLKESVTQARKAGCEVGAGGWTKMALGPEDAPPVKLIEKWIEESYRLMAPAKK